MRTHRTGIDDNDIGIFGAVGLFIAHFVQHAGDTLGICLVLLAAKSLGEGLRALSAHLCLVLVHTGDELHIFILMCNLFLRDNCLVIWHVISFLPNEFNYRNACILSL